MKSKLVTFAALAMTASSALAAVSLNFNAEFASGVPQNLSNSLGVPSNGLFWGVLIDGGGNGLITGANKYDNISLGLGQNYIMSVAGAATDDILYIAAQATSDTSGSTEGDGVTPGGPGGIFSLVNIALANGVGTGDKFHVVWFDGSVAGTLTDASFTIPSDGALVDYGDPFVGVDPVRVAGLAYNGTSGVSTGAGVSLVPEPSAALLGALGALGLLRRRRN